MKKDSRGFTLIETLVATAILVPALVSIAFVFVYATAANVSNGHRAACTLLASDKLERLHSAAPDSAAWTPGVYEEYVEIAADGSVALAASDSGQPYYRVWQIAGGSPPATTVIVYSLHSGLSGQPIESVRATTLRP